MARPQKPITVCLKARRGEPRWVAKIRDPRAEGKLRERFVYTDGTPPSKQTKTGAEKRAIEILDRWKRESTNPLALFGLIELAKREPGKSKTRDTIAESSRIQRSYYLDAFKDWAGDIKVASIEPVLIQEYEESIRARGCVEATVSRHRCAIKRMFSFAIESRMVDDSFRNPVTTVTRKKPISRSRMDVVKKAMPEPDRLVIAAALSDGWTVEVEIDDREGCAPYKLRMPVEPSRWFVAYVVTMDETGMRESEARKLRWEGVDFGESLISIEDSKTGSRFVPMTDRLRNALEEYGPKEAGFLFPGKIDNEPIGASAPRASWKRMLAALGITHRRQNSLRHAAALRMFERGVPANQVAEILGHGDNLSTTMIYSMAGVESMRRGFLSKMQCDD